MALTHCQECGKEISDKATVCPHCGYTYVRIESKIQSILNFEESREAKLLKIIAIIVFIVAFICGILMARQETSEYSYYLDKYYTKDYFSVGTMLLWWFGGFVTGTFILGFRKIINLLQEISDK